MSYHSYIEVSLLYDPSSDTDFARLFYPYSRDGQPAGEKIWIPRSQMKSFTKFARQPGRLTECRVEIPEWLVEKKGLI